MKLKISDRLLLLVSDTMITASAAMAVLMIIYVIEGLL